MPAAILRWKSGSGGDLLLYWQSLSRPGSVVNVIFDQIGDLGKTQVNFSKLNFANLREIDKIALDVVRGGQINLTRLSAEIAGLGCDNKKLWLKSHVYENNEFDSITTDLVADPMSLPFVITCSLIKTDCLMINFNALAKKIKDPQIRQNYTMYSVAVDNVKNYRTNHNKKIMVSNLLIDLTTVTDACARTDLELTDEFSHVYNFWLNKNQKYLPGKKYQQNIIQGNYDFMDTDLSLAERYSLLALSNSKFINL